VCEGQKKSWPLVVFVLWWLFDATSKERNIQSALLMAVLLWCTVMQQVPHAA